MWVSEGQGENYNIEQNNKGQHIPILGHKDHGFLHENVTKDIQQGVFIEHFEDFKTPIGNNLIDKVIFLEIEFDLDLVDGELVGLVDLGDDFEFLLHEFGELEL